MHLELLWCENCSRCACLECYRQEALDACYNNRNAEESESGSVGSAIFCLDCGLSTAYFLPLAHQTQCSEGDNGFREMIWCESCRMHLLRMLGQWGAGCFGNIPHPPGAMDSARAQRGAHLCLRCPHMPRRAAAQRGPILHFCYASERVMRHRRSSSKLASTRVFAHLDHAINASSWLKALFLLSERRTRFVDTWDANPYFSNAGITCKQVGDKIKRQATVDFNSSGVSGCTAKRETCAWPRTLDLIDDFMHQRQAVHGSSSSTEMVEQDLFECLLYCCATDCREAALYHPAA